MDKQKETLPKIMSKPLPQILDEMDENTRLAAEAAAAALRAKDEAMRSAEQARLSGEKAGREAGEAADRAIGETRDQLNKKIDDLKLNMDEAIKKARSTASEESEYALKVAREALETAQEALALAVKISKFPMAMLSGAAEGYNKANKEP